MANELMNQHIVLLLVENTATYVLSCVFQEDKSLVPSRLMATGMWGKG